MDLPNVEDFRVEGVPDVAYYLPNFISQSDEQYALNQIGKTSKVKWTQLSNRRLQNWGGVPHPKVTNILLQLNGKDGLVKSNSSSVSTK